YQQPGQAGGGRGLATGEPQGMSQGCAVITAKLGDGDRPLAAAQHGQDDQSQDGLQRMASAAAATRVGHRGQDFNQGKSHDKPPFRVGACPLYSFPLLLPISTWE